MKGVAVFAVLVVMAAIASPVSSEIDMEVKFEDRIQHFIDYRYPSNAHEDALAEARKYIRDQFKQYGLRVQEHNFNTTISDLEGKETTVVGSNIIGVAEAKSDHPGAVLVVGADYSTNAKQMTRLPGEPLFNNGGGVAAMLEAARLFMHNAKWSGHYRLNYTTVFVAFDLNTRELSNAPGEPGSSHFVREWLWPFLNQSADNFGGAFILDSILNLNMDDDTQKADENFRRAFPELYSKIKESNNRGDFLGGVTQNDNTSTDLLDKLYINYSKDKSLRHARMEKMVVKTPSLNMMMEELTTQAAMHFWAFNANETATPLPAVLITDTENLRENPSTCGSRCHARDIITEQRREFVEHTTLALVHTLLRSQATERDVPPSSAGLAVPSVLATLLMLLCHRLLQ